MKAPLRIATLAEQVERIVSDDASGARGGCSDGGCLVRKPTGMHTNSAKCYCIEFRGLTVPERFLVRRLLHERLTLLRAARGDQ